MSARCLAALALLSLVGVASEAGAARFAVYGDTRDNPAVHAKVVAQLAASQSAFAIFTGDAVLHGDTPAEWATFSRIEQPLADAGMPIYAVRGNHDTGPPFLQHFTPLRPPTTGTETYYAFDALGVHFLGMDTEGDDATDSPQFQFVKRDLEAHRGGAPIVVFLHRALFSSGHHGDDTRLDSTYVALFKAAHVLAVFQGHDHDYERSHPLEGVTYFVEGGGGAEQRPFEGPPPEWSALRAQVFGYVLVDVLAAALDVHAYDENGTLIDQVSLPFPASAIVDAGPTLTPKPPPPDPAPSVPPPGSQSSGDMMPGGVILGAILISGLVLYFWLGRRKPRT